MIGIVHVNIITINYLYSIVNNKWNREVRFCFCILYFFQNDNELGLIIIFPNILYHINQHFINYMYFIVILTHEFMYQWYELCII